MASETNPSITQAKRLPRTDKFREEFIPRLQKDINSDAQGIDQFFAEKRKAYDRRYQQDSREGTNFPWPGASTFNYPGSDIEIDQAKPGIMNIVFGGRRICDAIPINPDAAGQATNAGIAMEYLLRYRMGERGVPDYYRQTSLSADSFLQHGTSIDKIIYSYLTERRRERYTRQTLPDRLKLIQVVDAISPEEQQQFMQSGVLVISRDQFPQFAEQIEGLVVDVLNLDLQNREDRIVLRDVMEFIKANRPEAELDLVATQVVEDSPRVINCELESVIVPPGTRTLASASRVAHDMWFTENDLRMRSVNGIWDSDVVDLVLESAATTRRAGQIDGNRLHDAMRRRTDTDYQVDRDDAHFKVTEVYCYKLNAQKIPVPVVVTMERQMGAVLRAVEYDFAHGAWPFVETCYEQNEHDFRSSRGIPEKIKGLERHMSALMRAELNGLMMQTSQSFTYRMNSGINPQKLRWMPHLMIPVRNHDDLSPIPVNTAALALERPMLFMQGLMSKVSGGRLDTSTNEMRQDRPPTATQVSEQSLARQSSQGLRGMYFQQGRSAIYKQVWSLWRQFGPAEFYAMVANEPLKTMSQHEIRGEFQMVPVGAVGDMDPDYRVQQSMQVLDLLMKTQPLIEQDPRYVADITEAVKEVFDRMDPTISMRLLKRRGPEEMQQFAEQQQQEAQRRGALKQEAERLQMGAAVTPEGALALLMEIRQESPHRDLQPVIEGARQAEAASNRTKALLGDGAS